VAAYPDFGRDFGDGALAHVQEAALTSPALTTVAQPYRRIAERAVEAILDGRMPAGREVLPLALIIRGSTGRAPSKEESR
jgi:DNA-binding LacI/PurR family transcriptional regulator